MQVLTWVWVGAAVVLLFGASIFVHEFGHFLVARWRGLKVEALSIGFGPKIIGWTRNGIEYAWRWIPAGGYVKLPQMLTSEALEGKQEGEWAQELPPISPGSKILVALAGPTMNVLFAFLLATILYFVGLPVRVNPAIIGAVEPGTPEGELGLRAGDRVVAVNGKRVKSWEEAQMIAAMAPTNVLPVSIAHDGATNTYFLKTEVNKELGLKLLNLAPMAHPVIQEVGQGSAAQMAGLKPGDKVLEFGGVPIVGQEQLVNLIKKRPGMRTSIGVERGRERLELTVTPRPDPATRTGLLGVVVAPDTTSVYQLQWPGPPPWELVGKVCDQTFATIGALFHSRQTGVGIDDLSGPPGILAMLAAETKADFRLGLRFMVLLNISLAILNLLPLPVLDGGHIGLAVIEKLRGRPVSARIQEYATTMFAVLLISFMLYVSYNDVIRRFPLFDALFDQQVQIESGATHSNAPPAGR